MNMSINKESLHNIDAEQALLGAILLHNGAYERAVDIVETSHFYDPLHAAIYKASSQLLNTGKSVSPVTLRTFFESSEPISSELTVPQYLVRLAANATSIVNARDYAQTIRDLAMRRQIIMIAEDAARAAYASDIEVSPEDVVEGLEQQLYLLTKWGNSERNIIGLDEAMMAAVSAANEAHLRGTGFAGLSSGLRGIDNLLGGLSPSEVTILAGRPSMGKTALATNIAVAVCEVEPVGFCSMEMPAPELGRRALSEVTGISSWCMRTGRISELDMARMMQAQRAFQGKLFIDQAGGLTIAQLCARARRMRRKHGIGLLVIDYIQLMRGMSRSGSNSNRTQDVTEITQGLKALAKELDIPILALSQLSRQVEQRADKRPQLSDLRESGSIEQDADNVLFVFREEYYLQRAEPGADDIEAHQKWQTLLQAAAGKAEIIAGKCRHGPTDTIILNFDAATTTFRDREEMLV